MVSKALGSLPGIEETLIHTGQHYDDNLSQVFFDEMEIPKPVYNLGIGSGTHGKQTGRMLEEIERILQKIRPDWVLVYGDTNSTLAGALAAAKLQLPVAHVEAGLRSFNRRMPEEINRILTDHTADLLFAPTAIGMDNLLREGFDKAKLRLVGDVMYDAALFYGDLTIHRSTILQDLRLEPNQYVLATVHRAENTDCADRLRSIVAGLSCAAEEISIVFSLHPRTRMALLKKQDLINASKRIRFVDPVGYLDMIMLERNAKLIVTDSGGVQKEAFFFSVPCVTLRTETEWGELVQMGWNRLAPPTDSSTVAAAVKRGLTEAPKRTQNPYGDGHAAEKIAHHLADWNSSTAAETFFSTVRSN